MQFSQLQLTSIGFKFNFGRKCTLLFDGLLLAFWTDIWYAFGRRWFRGYLEDLLTKDVKDVTEIRKIDVLKEVAVWLMAHSSQYFAVDDLCTRAGISKQTAENYMEALRAPYVFDKVPAWSKSDYDRVGKRAKWIVADTGLMANILKWNEDAVFEESAQNGKLVESWVYHELAAQADALGGYEIAQYRDKGFDGDCPRKVRWRRKGFCFSVDFRARPPSATC